MTVARSLRGIFACLIATVTSLFVVVPAQAVTPAPAWAPIAVSGPTNLPPGGEGTIGVYVQNVGGATSSGTITLKDELPAGLVTSKDPIAFEGTWNCTSGSGQSTVICTASGAVPPGMTVKNPVKIPVSVVASTPETLTNKVTVSGGSAAAPAEFTGPVRISSTPARVGVEVFTAGTYNADGVLNSQAGSHPYIGTSAVFVNTILNQKGKVVPAGDPKTISVALPPGFIGDPSATPSCHEGLLDISCPSDTQVGVAQPVVAEFGEGGLQESIHSVASPVGYPAKFTFSIAGIEQINVVASLRSDEDYGIEVESPNTPQILPVFGVFFTLWGVPAAPSHDDQRCAFIESGSFCGPSDAPNTAFITQPTGCALQAEQAPFVESKFDTWLSQGEFEFQKFPIPAVTGCDQLHFEADFTFEPDQTKSDSPVAFETHLTVPSEGLTNPEKLTTPEIKKTVVKLPKGVVLNAAAADGLGACSEAQIGLKGNNFPAPNRIRFNKNPNQCSDASKIGVGELKSALLDETLDGALYLAAQGNGNPFGSLFALYLVIENPRNGIFIKLPGEVETDKQTGQMTVTFEDLPQLPFTSLKLKLKGGNRAPLANPTTCGEYVTTATNTPWSAPESGPPTVSSNGYTVNSGPNGQPCAKTPQERPFDIGLKAGTASSKAGDYSPLTFQITRPDGSQELDTLDLNTAPGLSASLKGIPECSDGALAAAEHKTGRQELASPSCPGASQVGRALVGSGSGPTPFYSEGKLYLSGPYKGAPLSVVAVTPAVAGPFDLGNVVVRTAVFLNRQTAQVTAKTDPIPQILEGVPLRIRDVRVILDRKGFSLNPTSCDQSAITIHAKGNSGATADRSARFQVGGCEDLAFKPKLTAKLTGATKRGDLPAFTATLEVPQGGYANIKQAQVTLPHSEFLEQAHINTVCTRVQAAAHACPAGSIYGFAEAETPLLDGKLTGPVFLKSSDHKLPDLAIALRGPDSQPVEVEFAGRIDSIHSQIRDTIEGLPDVPVTKFVLKMKGGKKGLLVNSRDLCKGRPTKMTVDLVAQNNKTAESTPLLANSCKHAHKQKRHHKRKR